MKKITMIAIVISIISVLMATEMIIHKTNGTQITVQLDEIGSISFSGGPGINLSFSAFPMHIDWDEDDDPPDDQSVLMTVRVLDEENNPVPDISIVFTGTLGNPENGEYTEITDAEGYIYKYWQFHEYECPLPAPDGSPGVATATLTVQIMDTSIDSHTTILLRRYDGDI